VRFYAVILILLAVEVCGARKRFQEPIAKIPKDKLVLMKTMEQEDHLVNTENHTL
jgi:hypothetical protein